MEYAQKMSRKTVPEQPKATTLFEMLLNSCEVYRDNTAFIYRMGGEEVEVSYSKLFEDVLLLSRALDKRGLAQGDKVMFLSDNRKAPYH